jgi:hypothetical protein
MGGMSLFFVSPNVYAALFIVLALAINAISSSRKYDVMSSHLSRHAKFIL